MRYVSPTRFRADCARFRLLAFITAACIVVALGLASTVPIARGTLAMSDPHFAADLVRLLPAACYVLGIVFVGQAVGRLASGRPVQQTLASALRRIGVALASGGVFNVFLVTNLERMILGTRGGYVYFDVGSMTLAVIGAALVLLAHVVDQAVLVQAELDEMF